MDSADALAKYDAHRKPTTSTQTTSSLPLRAPMPCRAVRAGTLRTWMPEWLVRLLPTPTLMADIAGSPVRLRYVFA